MSKRPNVLIVMTDQQRGDSVLDSPMHTPHADRLAAEGVRFTQAYCPTAHCCPARASFFSGLYPTGHGVWNNLLNGQRLSRGLNEGVQLWSEDLVEAGYACHFLGKWHVSAEERPADRGWEEQLVSAVPGDLHGVPWEHFANCPPDPEHRPARGRIDRPGWGDFTLFDTREDPFRQDRAVTDAACELLPDLAKQDDPWCCYVGLFAPHDPYQASEADLAEYPLAEVELPPNHDDSMPDKPGYYRRLREQVFARMDADEQRDAIRHYYAATSLVDRHLGRILDALEASGQAEDTIVLFCSDHGDYCGEHGLFAKGVPAFTSAYHVPWIIRWPGAVADPGRDVDALVSLTDWAPTVLGACGVEVDARRFDGRDLAPFLRGETPEDWRDALFFQCDGVEVYMTQRGVRTAKWHYSYNAFDCDELYDLEHDPHQLVNLAGKSEYDSVVKELCTELWRFAHAQQDTAINPYVTVGLAPYGPGVAFE